MNTEPMLKVYLSCVSKIEKYNPFYPYPFYPYRKKKCLKMDFPTCCLQISSARNLNYAVSFFS